MAATERKYGDEQACINLGIFKLRLPLIHYKWAWPECIQGLFVSAVSVSAITYHMRDLGAGYEVALTMVILNELLYMIHATLGDPICPGWITPSIPLTLAFLSGYEMGPDRVKALIALQLLMAVLFFFMAITGLAKKVISYVPISMQAGILLGAGLSALYSVIRPGGRVAGMELTFYVGFAVCIGILYSLHYGRMTGKYPWMKILAKFGMVPGMIVALIFGIAIGQVETPTIQWTIFTDFRFGELLSDYSVFGLGFPEMKYFVAALPLMVTVYIIAFGDFVLAETVVSNADTVRRDEKIEFNPSRSNFLSSFRNLIEGLFAPHITLAGPLWGAGTIAVAERYKTGRENMDSVYDGMGTLKLAMIIGVFLMPVVTLFTPVMPILVSLTLAIQGFACGYIGMEMLHSREERACAFTMALFVAFQSALMGLVSGIILHLLIGRPNKEELAKQQAELAVEQEEFAKLQEEKEREEGSI